MEKNYVINTWLKFLNYENIERAKFSLKNIKNEEIIDFNKSIKKDEEEDTIFKIEELTSNFLRKKYKKNEDLFLLFPLIKETRIDKNSGKVFENLIPLFAINLEDRKNSVLNGKNIFFNFKEDNKYQVLINVFKEVFGIEENFFAKNYSFLDLIEELTNTKPKNFLNRFELLENFFNENSKNEKYSFYQKNCLISNINTNIFNEDLIDELKKLKKYEIKPNELLNQYIINNKNFQFSNKFSKNKIWYGQYDDFPLSIGQSTVMQKYRNGVDILPVQGGPGTGKTTLFMSIMSSQITNRRLNIINNNEDYNNLTLITSTSNKSVDNISDKFEEEFPDYEHLYFISGNLEKNKKSIVRVNKLIEKLYSNHFNDKKYNSLKNEINQIISDFNTNLMEYEQCNFIFENLKDRFKNDNILEILNIIKNKTKEVIGNTEEEFNLNKSFNYYLKKLKNLKNERIKKEGLEELIKKNFYSLVNENFDLNLNFEEIVDFVNDERLEEIFSYKTKIYENKRNFLYSFKMFFNKNNNILSKFKSKNRTFVKKYNLKKINDDNIVDYLKIIKIILNIKEEFIIELEEYKSLVSHEREEYKNIRKKYEALKYTKDLYNKYSILYNKYGNNFREHFRVHEYQKNRKLFKLSEEFMFQYTLKNKKEVIKSLDNWKNILVYSKNMKKSLSEIEEDLDYFYKHISMVYPFITTTLTSVRNVFKIDFEKYKDVKRFDLCLADERGMIGVHNLSVALYRSKRRVIIGDTKQLEPIITLSKNVIDEYEEIFDTKEDFQKYSPTEATAYHRTRFCKNKLDNGYRIFLDEHRRCQDIIANTFIELSNYKGLKIKTESLKFNDNENANSINNRMYYLLKDFDNKNLVFFNVKKQRNSFFNTNFNEVEKIEQILDNLESNNVNLKEEVVIITPFLNQEKILKKYFSKRLNDRYGSSKIGTVHKFQGTEFPIIIFSSVISLDTDDDKFLNNKPNLLNVSLSRAKFLYIHVGDFDRLSNVDKGILKTYTNIFKKYSLFK